MRGLLALCAAGALAAASCSAGEAAPRETAQDASVRADIRRLAQQVEAVHPRPFHSRPRAEWRGAVDRLVARVPELGRNQLLVELMRLAALGPRDGHGGLYPLAPDHERPLHLLPLRLWSFPEGLYVVGSLARPELVGLRLVAVAGRTAAEVAAAVRPLVAYDNRWSRELRVPEFMITVEVLHGLGLVESTGPVRLTLARRDGSILDATVTPVSARTYVGAAVASWHEVWTPPDPPGVATPLWLRNRDRSQWFASLDRGRVVYAAYSMTTADTYAFGEELLRRARRPGVRRVIVDVRGNGGGNNTTYASLVQILASPALRRPGRLVLLTSRVTFSAGANFVGEVDRLTRARIVGEPAGGSPNNFGDRVGVALPSLGWTVYVAPQYVEVVRGDRRTAVGVDVAVPLTAAAFFAGRDPVLQRALR